MPTILPTQLGSTIFSDGSGPVPKSQSQIFIGRDLAMSFEAIGFGVAGRPDPVENLIINLTLITNAPSGPTKLATISFKASDLQTLITANTNIPNPIQMSLMEVDVCDQSIARKMIILGSAPYDPAPATPSS